jgi:predicted Ser/Thr protein kinase
MKVGLGSEVQGEGERGAEEKRSRPFVSPSVAEVARIFPQLEILELLGAGGMGAVYKARQPGLDRVVALKVLPPQPRKDPGFAERFTREARALAKLSHSNIVGVYEFGQMEGLHYFIMEYVDGPNLRQLEQAAKLSSRQALQIIPQICEALQFAHDEGIVHRDIKPENVLLDKKGRVKIADFGLAKILKPENLRLTGARDVVGTPHYMAPEQVEHPQEVDHRADIYSLGVVFYEMLTGELPLGKFAPPSEKAQVDMRLDEVVLHSLEKEPERRYQHASDIKTDLETIAATPRPVSESAERESQVARESLLNPGVPKAQKRWGWRRTAIAGATVFALLAIITGFLSRTQKPAAAPAAGATEIRAASRPVVVRTVPESGVTNVDPAVAEIQVTFSKEMMTEQMWSFCQVSKATFPELAGEIHYLEDKRTCVMPVKLEPGRTYVIWVNRGQFENFRDIQNNPSVPYLIVFETRE